MAVKKARAGSASPEPLVIGLSDPGMTPLLRAGLGGLAASLRAALLEKNPEAPWPAPVHLGGGTFTVEPRRITIDWGSAAPEKVLEALFAHAFRLTKQGLIDLPGTYDASLPPTMELAAALHSALQRTILQHNKHRPPAGVRRTVSFAVDERTLVTTYQPYATYEHQRAWRVVAEGRTKPVRLAGWAYPGAAQRHVQFVSTKQQYRANDALCAVFALVGTVSVDVPSNGGGALVIPEPTDLVAFAEARHRMTPRTVPEAHVAGVGDAVLAVSVALRADSFARHKRAVGRAHGVLLRATAWGGKQKYRVGVVSASSFADALLDEYYKVERLLPTRLHAKPASAKEADGGYFASPSAFRGFVADNLASGRRWQAGFATATTTEKRPRFIHYYREKGGLGALWEEERKGLIAMLEHMDAAEKALVRSVHVALRQRFGEIKEESKENKNTMKNRWQRERDRWRFAFAGSKTPEQIRSALANLWSRAGSPNRELQESWEAVLPLLRAEHWQAARDLALVALASYQGAGVIDDNAAND